MHRLESGLSLFLAVGCCAVHAQDSSMVCDHASEAIVGNPELARLHASFDGKSERRIFSEVHFYSRDPHLTVGMGHWTYGNLSQLFQKIRAKPDDWDNLLRAWAAAMTPSMWSQFSKDTSLTEPSTASLEKGLVNLLCIEKSTSKCMAATFTAWSKQTGIKFNDPSNWFNAGWKASSRLPGVARIQVEHWLASVVSPSEQTATAVGAVTLGGTAAFASARSSATSFSNIIAREVRVASLPPDSSTPKESNDQHAKRLEDWRSVLAWAGYYDRKEWSKRERMSRIWTTYFAATWGAEPAAAGDTKRLKHSGCFMARGNVIKEFYLRTPGSNGCEGLVNRPPVAVCWR